MGKDGLYLTKAELKEYGVLNAKSKRKKGSRRKGKFQNERVSKGTTSQGIRSTSDHMKGFGTQINRTNDLTNELTRQIIDRAEKVGITPERLALTNNPQPLQLTHNPDYDNQFQDLKSYINREGHTFHNRLLNIERNHNPSFRVNSSPSASDRFKTYGHHNINPNDPSTFETIAKNDNPITENQLPVNFKKVDRRSLDRKMERQNILNYHKDNPWDQSESDEDDEFDLNLQSTSEESDQEMNDNPDDDISDRFLPRQDESGVSLSDQHVQKLEELNNQFVNNLKKVRSPYNLRKNPKKTVRYNINIKKEPKKKSKPEEQEQITTPQLFEPEPTKEAGIPGPVEPLIPDPVEPLIPDPAQPKQKSFLDTERFQPREIKPTGLAQSERQQIRKNPVDEVEIDPYDHIPPINGEKVSDMRDFLIQGIKEAKKNGDTALVKKIQAGLKINLFGTNEIFYKKKNTKSSLFDNNLSQLENNTNTQEIQQILNKYKTTSQITKELEKQRKEGNTDGVKTLQEALKVHLIKVFERKHGDSIFAD